MHIVGPQWNIQAPPTPSLAILGRLSPTNLALDTQKWPVGGAKALQLLGGHILLTLLTLHSLQRGSVRKGLEGASRAGASLLKVQGQCPSL